MGVDSDEVEVEVVVKDGWGLKQGYVIASLRESWQTALGVNIMSVRSTRPVDMFDCYFQKKARETELLNPTY